MTTMNDRLGLAGFNALADDAAGQVLLRCCSSPSWGSAVAAGRPYASLDALLAASDAAVAGLTERDLREALVGHPRIGAPLLAGGPDPTQVGTTGAPRASDDEWSSQEQAGVSSADGDTRRALIEGNAEYERRFGHIYLACASGKSAAELLAFLHERLGNDAGTEWRVVASELAKINQLRLRKLIGVEA